MGKNGKPKTCGDEGGQKSRGEGPCSRPAGWGTAHSGEGLCRDHDPEFIKRRQYTPSKPKDWDAAVAVAFFWTLGATVAQASGQTGVPESTIKTWTPSAWWPDAVAEAEGRWLKRATAESRRTLLASIAAQETKDGVRPGDVHSARWLLERTDEKLAPPKQQIEMNHNFLHRDVVVQIFVGLTRDAGELIEDPEKRDEFLRRAEVRLTGIDDQKALPEKT